MPTVPRTVHDLRWSSPARLPLSTAAAALRKAAAAVTVRELRCGVGRGELDGGCERTGWDSCGRPCAVWAMAGRAGRARPRSGLTSDPSAYAVQVSLQGRTTLSRSVTDVCDGDKWLGALTHVP